MKFWREGGWWLPDDEQHFQPVMRNPKRRNRLDGRLTYQYHKYSAALPFMRDKRVAVDIGAHVGLWSWFIARDFERVLGFEPISEHRECWVLNMADVDNATLYPYALGEHEGEVRLSIRDANSSGSIHVDEEGERAQLKPLDSFGLQDVDFIKIDVEGYELPALKGAVATIQRCRPVVLVEQKANDRTNFGRPQNEAVDFLQSLGMKSLRPPMSGDWILGW